MTDPRSTKAAHVAHAITLAGLLDMADEIVKERLTRLDITVKGDLPGHEFHGNQWTGGAGGSGEGFPSDSDSRTGSNSPSDSHYEQWRNELTGDQKESINQYTGGGFRSLNEQLREGQTLSPKNQKMSDDLDAAIENAPAFSEPVIVYRGINVGDNAIAGHGRELAMMDQHEVETATRKYVADYAESKFSPGDTVAAKSFQSTSFNIEPALDASISKKAPGLIFEIKAHKGAYLSGLSKYDDENELLLSRNTKYKVVKVIRSATFDTFDSSVERTIIQVEQIND